jgi:hypothetical protein
MGRAGKRGWIFDWLWFVAWAAASSVWCWTAGWNLGATFDEPVYIARGLDGWRTGSHQGLLRLGTMPLALDLDTLPLYLRECWQGNRFDADKDLEQLLPWARTGTLVFWWLLLFYGRLAGRHMAGPWGGRLAVAFLACEPCLLAHASLATTDLAITSCLLALMYHYRTGREAGWLRRVALPGFWLGAALLSKASALAFAPLCLFVAEMDYQFRRAEAWDGKALTLSQRFHAVFGSFCRDGIGIACLALVLTFVYCGSDWQAEPSFVQWAQRLPEGPGSRALVWLAEHLRIFSNAAEGLVRQVKHNIRGHGTYLLGEVADRSIWYYFPVALSIKLSLPLLLLPVVLLLIRPRALINWACLAALALLVFSLTCRVQIGIRLVLPLIALAVVGLAAAAARSIQDGGGRIEDGESSRPFPSPVLPFACRHPLSSILYPLRLVRQPLLLALFVSAGIVWTMIQAGMVWPEGLCYTNELWGGTANGYLLLSDSNYDWGQGLKELARWQEAHADAPVDVWYFGTDPALHTLPAREVRFQTLGIKGPEDVWAHVKGHYLAVSTTLLRGSLSTLLRRDTPEWISYWCARHFLEERQPADRTTTFLIYDFRERHTLVEQTLLSAASPADKKLHQRE